MREPIFSSDLTVPGIVAASFVLLLIVEAVFPLRCRTRPLARRIFTNLFLSAFVFAAGAYIVSPVGAGLAAWTSERPFGLLPAISLPFTTQFVIGFLLMDLTFYYWHRANHFFPILWRFHNVHHIDPDMDVSTSFRFHVVEILYSAVFRILQVGLIGIQPITYAVYELAFTCATMFHHSNMRLPIRLERWLNTIIVTPRMHGIHHSAIQGETDSNYSVIFRWWDKLNRSLQLNVPQSDITIGVTAYQEPEDNALRNLFTLPFQKQREYWRSSNGIYPVREPVTETVNAQLWE